MRLCVAGVTWFEVWRVWNRKKSGRQQLSQIKDSNKAWSCIFAYNRIRIERKIEPKEKLVVSLHRPLKGARQTSGS